MRALHRSPEGLELRDLPVPEPGPDQALIRVRLAGICATDLAILRGYAGFSGIPGHEFVGEVVHAAPEQARWIGQRVVGEINLACGHCPTCGRGRPQHCPSRRVMGIRGWNGALAEYCVLPLTNLHPVPPSLSDEEAVFTEPLAAALEILEQFHLRPSQEVTIIGDGKLGLLVAQVVRLTGASVRLVGHHPERWGLARGWGCAVLPLEEAMQEPAPVVVECSGSPSGLDAATRLLAPEGTLILKTTHEGASPLYPTPLVVGEHRLLGSRCGPFVPALRLLERRLVETQPLIAARLPLSQGLLALESARGTLKVLVNPHK